MLSRLWGSTLVGLESVPVQVEVDVSPGLPGFHVVGLPDAAVSESSDRVRTALRNAGFLLPARRITVNLAPGDLRKEGPRFDLAIALGLLVVGGVVDEAAVQGALVLGELALDGALRPVRGVLAAVLQARRQNLRRVILPLPCVAEASLVPGLEIVGVESLDQALEVLSGRLPRPTTPVSDLGGEGSPEALGLIDQPLAVRALELAAAGSHHLLLSGPPGCGKTHLARCLPGILPPLSQEQALEVLLVRSVASADLTPLSLPTAPPFQEPDMGVTWAGLFGGYSPGEVTRAHQGVLFLDEIPEFRRSCLEGLRTVLDTGRVEIVRAQRRLVYPASFLLVAAMNPCPCGYFGDPQRHCHCPPARRLSYYHKLSGPLRDRIDLHVVLGRPDPQTLLGLRPGCVSPLALRQQVVEARRLQEERGCLNSRLQGAALEQACRLAPEERRLLARAATRFQMSGRTVQRTLRLARTIADLAGAARVEGEHLGEALGYRPAILEQAA